MGLSGLLKKSMVCPNCRTPGAVKHTFGRTRCRNPACRHYDPSLAYESVRPSLAPGQPRRVPQGTFEPGPETITIRYRNYRGDDIELRGDRRTIRFRKAHVSLCVAPTGQRIALWQRFVRNLDELKQYVPRDTPTAVERQILSYHRKHGTTSPRYEDVRRKYPDWTR
jgi:hypothetical protein